MEIGYYNQCTLHWIFPQCILVVMDYHKGVHNWKFGKDFGNDIGFEFNDALFKSNYGNTIFASLTALFFLALIILFFGSGSFFGNKGIHCKFLTFLCCPCPKPCINYNDQKIIGSSKSKLPETSNNGEVMDEYQVPKVETSSNCSGPHTEVYLYTKGGESKIRLLGPMSQKKDDRALKVNFFHVCLRFSFNE